jgi:hypothetical protein
MFKIILKLIKYKSQLYKIFLILSYFSDQIRMSYGLARKEFECTNCVPPRTIKMLVGGDQESVTCQECRQVAKVKVKK